MNDEQAIRETISKWLVASKEGDAQTLGRILDDDMLFVILGRPPFGKQEFLAGIRGKPYEFHSTVEVSEIVVNGNWALTRVQLAIKATATQDAQPMQVKGPTMTVWRKAATGNWLIWRDANMVAPVS